MTWTEDHFYDSTRLVSTASYEGRVHSCACGALFMEKPECLAHVRAEGDKDALQKLLYSAAVSGLFVTVGSQIVERGFDLHSAGLRQFEVDREAAVVGPDYWEDL